MDFLYVKEFTSPCEGEITPPCLFLLQVAPPPPPLTDTPDATANAGESLPATMGGPLPPHLALKAGKGLESACMTVDKIHMILLSYHLFLIWIERNYYSKLIMLRECRGFVSLQIPPVISLIKHGI